MKKLLLLLAACLLSTAPGISAGADCAKSSDACRSQPAALTPFMAELKKATPGPAIEQKPAKAGKVPAPEPPAPPKISAPVPPADGGPVVAKKTFSRPGWLVAAALFLYGLYYFLKEGKKRKGRR